MFKAAKKRSSAKSFERRAPPPLDAQKLADLAYWYTGKYAVSVAKARQYLQQKLRQRSWSGPEDGDGSAAQVLDSVLARLVDYGAVNDQLVATAAVAGARRKGLAGMRVRMALSVRQVSAEAAATALASADESDGPAVLQDDGDTAPDEETPGLAAALRFARRKRLGPFRTAAMTPERRKKEISALIRAGHSFALAARVVDAADPEA